MRRAYLSKKCRKIKNAKLSGYFRHLLDQFMTGETDVWVNVFELGAGAVFGNVVAGASAGSDVWWVAGLFGDVSGAIAPSGWLKVWLFVGTGLCDGALVGVFQP